MTKLGSTQNMEGKVCDMNYGKMEKSDPKVFWESPSQYIYGMVLGFFYPWYFIVHVLLLQQLPKIHFLYFLGPP